MLATFPTCQFSFASREIMVRSNVISGGTALNGDEAAIVTDGGGRWVADYQNAPLNRREKVLSWRALRALLNSGTRAIIFPICDARHQPVVSRSRVPHSDGTPFSDDSLYSSGDCEVYAAADAPLRATSLTLNIVQLGKPLIAGERFSIEHPTWSHRLYEIATIEGDQVGFRPPLREAVTAGTALNFADPRCVMRLSGDMSAPLNGPRFAAGSLMMVEDMTGQYA
ncbi:hypothetical protein [Sphingobium yanoikuyae]|uniref:hypothetical protein n=1 Tax=Sphingobium yanoikuyae TaxID=13690 RepID=UPI0026EC30F9|nr:hypothetical protein [Sphingobium yanoikuyae]